MNAYNTLQFSNNPRARTKSKQNENSYLFTYPFIQWSAKKSPRLRAKLPNLALKEYILLVIFNLKA